MYAFSERQIAGPQSEANVCRHKCNLEKTSFIYFTGQPIMHRTPNTNYGLRSRTLRSRTLALDRTDYQIYFIFKPCSQFKPCSHPYPTGSLQKLQLSRIIYQSISFIDRIHCHATKK